MEQLTRDTINQFSIVFNACYYKVKRSFIFSYTQDEALPKSLL